jgi:hypothetical protein
MGDSLINPYVNSLAESLISKDANIQYDGYLRADKPVTYTRFVKLWADSGLFPVRLGIESASARVLESMNKKTSPSVISDVLKTLASQGIRTTTYWIVGSLVKRRKTLARPAILSASIAGIFTNWRPIPICTTPMGK